MGISRQEHLQWCKDRDLAYLESGDLTNAYASICSDMNKHEETRGQDVMALGMRLMIDGHLSSVVNMRNFIEGLN